MNHKAVPIEHGETRLAWLLVAPAMAVILLVSLVPIAVMIARISSPRRRCVRLATVINRRYGVVTKGGTLSTNPPLAIVYREGEFPRPAVPAVVPPLAVARWDWSCDAGSAGEQGTGTGGVRGAPMY